MRVKTKDPGWHDLTPGMKEELSGQGEFRKTAGYAKGSPHLAPASIVDCNLQQEILSLRLKEDVYKADFFFLVL